MRIPMVKHSVLGIVYYSYSSYLCSVIQITHRKVITVIKIE